MIVRIVKMTFHVETEANFLTLFEEVKLKILNFDGCTYLQLFKSKTELNVIYTYSNWESEKHLEKYRHSFLFEETWSKTKVLFAGKPEATSYDLLQNVEK